MNCLYSTCRLTPIPGVWSALAANLCPFSGRLEVARFGDDFGEAVGEAVEATHGPAGCGCRQQRARTAVETANRADAQHVLEMFRRTLPDHLELAFARSTGADRNTVRRIVRFAEKEGIGRETPWPENWLAYLIVQPQSGVGE